MVKSKKVLALFRLFFGLLGLSAVATEIVVLVNRGTFTPANFFSFFTIESNIFAALVLAASAFVALGGKRINGLDMFRGAAALYMVTTGIVFAVLLSGLEANVLTAVPWDNVVLHYIMPVVLLADWLIDPPKSRIALRRALTWLIYPVLYVVYSLVRGYFVGWYPYPFLNPGTNGYLGVALVSVGIAVTVLIISWFLTRVARTWSRP